MTKAQSMLEYALIISVIAGAATVMQTYFKRGIQAQIKVSCDQLAEQREYAWDFDPTQDRSPLYAESIIGMDNVDEDISSPSGPKKKRLDETTSISNYKDPQTGKQRPNIYFQGYTEE